MNPNIEEFYKLRKEFNLVTIYDEMDEVDVVDVLRNMNPKHRFALHSSRVDKLGRYSILGDSYFRIFKSKRNNIWIDDEQFSGNPIKELRKLVKEYKSPKNNSLPIESGIIGFFSYEIVHFFEDIPRQIIDDMKIWDMCFLFVNSLIIVDHEKKKTYLLGIGDDYNKCVQSIKRLKEIIGKKPEEKRGSNRKPDFHSNFTQKKYVEAVKKVKEYIRKGDTFQVNISQRLKTITDKDPVDLYEKLISINPCPFGGFFQIDDTCIISSSPERLVKLENGLVDTRPIAGTRPRGKTIEEDAALEKELKENEKELAEHTMLIDLERNDLGRVCEYGSVKLSEKMVIEKYSHVMHLVSNVKGRLHKDKDQFDLIRACFPGGTITGCPKVRTMEIIHEIEPNVRGPYTGGFGYLTFNGNMDLNILIRTITLKNKIAYIQAGGGIVTDSDPEKEFEETMHKAKALLEAIE